MLNGHVDAVVPMVKKHAGSVITLVGNHDHTLLGGVAVGVVLRWGRSCSSWGRGRSGRSCSRRSRSSCGTRMLLGCVAVAAAVPLHAILLVPHVVAAAAVPLHAAAAVLLVPHVIIAVLPACCIP